MRSRFFGWEADFSPLRMPSRATNTDAIFVTSSGAETGEPRHLHARHRGGDHGRPASPGQTRSASDIQQKLKEFRTQDIRSRFAMVAVTLAVLAGFAGWTWIEVQRFAGIEQEFAPPPNWDEQQYLSNNPDVAAAVRRGRFKSGWRHYLFTGVEEARKGVSIERLPTE